jgi:mannitol 2-dehydrogenase
MEFAPNDPIWDELHETALMAAKDPTIWLNMSGIYGDVGKDPVFVDAFCRALRSIIEDGVETSMLKYINKKRPGSIAEEEKIQTLSADMLQGIRDNLTLRTPAYHREQLTAGIVHMGVGNFHRAHQAAYIDELIGLADSYSNEWAIIGAGVMEFDAKKREALAKQDWVTTLVERQADYVSARLIGSMIDFVPVDPPFHGPLKSALLAPNIKIVSMTFTEGGYFLNSATGLFDPKHPAIIEEAANPDQPKTAFGLIVQALKKRREAGINPFTVMSCDNIPHNGSVVKGVVVGLTKLFDEELAQWISQNVGFPNSMVDRITPMTGEKERKFIKDELGYEDAWPVFCEPFKQWILEDDFPSGRPALERVGVQFVEDVRPYELMKIRILNGAHAALCYAAALLELEHVHDAMEHPTISAFLDTVQRTEVIPSVPPVPDTDLIDYWHLIQTRFGNPMILDTIDRICFDGASRQPKFIIPPAADNLRDGRPVEGLALVSAMWCRYCQGKAESGKEFAPNDPIWDQLHDTAIKAAEDPSIWLGMTNIYGDVGLHPTFVDVFANSLRTISNDGVETAMKAYIEKNAGN